MKPGTLVLVTWTDAFFEFDEPTLAPEGYDCTTVGYVVSDGRFLSVAQETTPEGYRATTHIPSALITNIRILTDEHMEGERCLTCPSTERPSPQ